MVQHKHVNLGRIITQQLDFRASHYFLPIRLVNPCCYSSPEVREYLISLLGFTILSKSLFSMQSRYLLQNQQKIITGKRVMLLCKNGRNNWICCTANYVLFSDSFNLVFISPILLHLFFFSISSTLQP